jgi:60 kDa SS-A/Ro ribonucleoprotein
MANKKLFKSVSSKSNVKVQETNTVNRAGGVAYSLTDEHALAQLAVTGTFNNIFYADAEAQLKDILALAQKVRPEFLAKVAVYARESGFMKDTSALLLAVLAARDVNLFKKVFNRVVDNGKMLRNFCQIVRSGVTGRKSFGSAPKRLIRDWLDRRTDKQLLEDSIGNDPELTDIIKMVHPKPSTKSREAFYAYLMGKEHNVEALPENVKEFEAFKRAPKGSRNVPNVPFQLLTALDLSDAEWKKIAENAKWHMTRMNLNTFARHNVLTDSKMVSTLADRLKNPEDIKKSKVFPYQLFTAYLHVDSGLPNAIKNALQDAMETATKNVPHLRGKVYAAVDCSGSMSCPVTGHRKGATTRTSCNQVAALMAACILRNSDDADVIRFDTNAEVLSLNARDSVMTNCQKIGFNGGGTDCSSPLRLLNQRKAKGDLVVILSDNESWYNGASYGRGTGLQNEWAKYKQLNPKAKLVCIDLAAGAHSQAQSSSDVLNVGGFSDQVFEVISQFIENDGSPDFWTKKIEREITLS